MPKPLQIKSGQKFGRLIIIKELESKNGRNFLCKCECGNKKIAKLTDLRRGHVKSCGCLQYESQTSSNISHGQSKTRLYGIWNGMKQRCFNKNSKNYEHYGNRGITVCEEWKNSFEHFKQWSLNNGYNENLSLERINNNQGYYPENCKWATVKQQGSNRRTNININRNGVTRTLKEWCEIEKVPYLKTYKRLKRGWDIERALKE
ncbi:hypothetical protein H8Z65_14130 [Mycobacterium avium subsp. hominissuis]|uniref:hypothetical protein n=1 Tax=Mycobacterium avium TaxID=1764 RepID=UPI001CE1FDDE|nr:hypothetical protein [Mycobacterium avium]MCA4764682.1 hypothetical protein [Mycobacterium avium subsp. hominissuis]